MAIPPTGPACPYCQSAIRAGARRVVCPTCQRAHHADCWEQNGGCTTTSCKTGTAAPRAASARPPRPAAAAPPVGPAPLPRPEVQRLLSEFELRVRQGLIAQARERLDQIKLLAPDHPAVREAEGDLALAQRKLREAEGHYRDAFHADPGNARLEEKYANLVVRLKMPDIIAHLPPDDAPIWEGQRQPRQPWVSAMLSMVIPGVGQLHNGDMLKGGILAFCSVALVGWQLSSFAPVLRHYKEYGTRDQLIAALQQQMSLVLVALFAFIWIYAVIDAAVIAAQSQRKRLTP